MANSPGYRTHQGGRPRELDATDLDIEARLHAGETAASIGRALGLSPKAVMRRRDVVVNRRSIERMREARDG